LATDEKVCGMAGTTRRRNVAAAVAFALLIVLVVVAWRRPVGYAVFSPGPTVNVLGTSAGKQIIDVSGHPTYRDEGGLRLVTVYETSYDNKVSLLHSLQAWADPDEDVYPFDAVYPKDTTQKAVHEQSAAQMASSQDDAIAAALRALGISYGTTQRVAVAAVDDTGPAHDLVHTGDLIVSVDGTAVGTPDQLVDQVRDRPPGSKVALTVDRDGDQKSVTVTTARLGDQCKQAEQSRIGVSVSSVNRYRFPFDVRLHLADNIGGPSAGLMFALGVYDVLTPGSLTDGKVIAGTGEIDAQGKVGAIGGVQQKIAGAQHDGARLFLVPAGNCAEAVHAHYDADKIRLVRVTSLSDALSALKTWTSDPGAELPGCRR
jgi:PDZ domain-containing protein